MNIETTENKKFVDDLTLLEVINLRENLVHNEVTIQPLYFHERYGLRLPPERTILPHKLKDLFNFETITK